MNVYLLLTLLLLFTLLSAIFLFSSLCSPTAAGCCYYDPPWGVTSMTHYRVSLSYHHTLQGVTVIPSYTLSCWVLSSLCLVISFS